MVKEIKMLLDKEEDQEIVDALKEAYELGKKIDQLTAKLKPIRDGIKELMEKKETTVLYHPEISARIQHRCGHLKWDTNKIKLIVGERFDEFQKECSKMTNGSKALSIELVTDKKKKVG